MRVFSRDFYFRRFCGEPNEPLLGMSLSSVRCAICPALWCLILWLSFTYGAHSIYARLFLPGYGQDIPVHFSAYLSRSEHEPITNRSENGHNNTSHSGTKNSYIYIRKKYREPELGRFCRWPRISQLNWIKLIWPPKIKLRLPSKKLIAKHDCTDFPQRWAPIWTSLLSVRHIYY